MKKQTKPEEPQGPGRPPFTLPPDRLRMMVELLVDVACPELRLPETPLVKPVMKKRKAQRPGSGSARGSNAAADVQS